MIRLYLSDDLLKSTGSPPTGGGPKGVSPPKVPGAATGGSGPQVVDCPLGAGCPDGGRHQMGSEKLQKHTAQAQQGMQTGQMPGDESTGEESGKPGVPPGAANIGGVGSDQVKRTPPPVDQTMVDTDYAKRQRREGSGADKTVVDSPYDKRKRREQSGKTESAMATGGKTQPEMDAATRPVGEHEIPTTGHDPGAPDDRQTLREFPAYASEESGYESPASERKTLHDTKISPDRPRRQDVPNPLVADESAVPPNSKPMDHYKLSQVARESGDEDLAKFHEGMARKRTEGMGSEDHRQLAEQLHGEGMHEQAQYHSGIHQRVGELEGGPKEEPTPDESKKHEESMRGVHHEARSKAKSDLESAKKKHEETKAKADKIRAANEEKIKAHEEATKEYEKAKAEGSKKKPPKKPKLDKEEKVPEKPELSEPENDAEKLRHEGHTGKAKRLADMAESHLKGNKDLTPEQKQRLERAHKMAVYHSNVEYTPTAAHKKELGEVEQAISGMGIKGNHEDMAAAENAKKTAEAAKQAAKDQAAQSKQQAKQDKTQAKEQQKLDAAAPKPPQSDLDHARVADHKSKAQKLRSNVESHMAGNPDMSPEEKAKAERILNELGKHENMEMMPGSDHESELKELQKLAGDHGKKPYEAEAGGDESGSGPQPRQSFGNAGGYVLPMLHSGRALGTGLAASATSPYGAAGHLGPQIVSYGVTGATTAGHRLLHDSGQAAKDEKDIQEGLDQEKEEQAKRAKQAARQGSSGEVVGRGSQ